MAELVLVREKMLSVQVCAPRDWDAAKVEWETNGAHPCGTTAGWVISTHVENPVVCEEDENRRHWVLDA